MESGQLVIADLAKGAPSMLLELGVQFTQKKKKELGVQRCIEDLVNYSLDKLSIYTCKART